MEDVAEDAVVDNLLIVVIRLAQTLDIVVVELQGAAHVAVDGSGGEEGGCLAGCDGIATSGTVRSGGGGTEAATQGFDDGIALGDGTRLGVDDVLTSLERQLTNGGGTLDEQLEHEARHLAGMAVGGGVVITQGNIVGTAQQMLEVVFVDGHLIVDGGQSESFADTIWNERGIVDAAWHVAFVGREQQYVVEVEVTRLKYAHNLQAHGWLAVEGNGRLLDKLCDEALQGNRVNGEVAAFDEGDEAVQQSVGAEEGFSGKGLGLQRLGEGGHECGDVTEKGRISVAGGVASGEGGIEQLVSLQILSIGMTL